MQPHMTARSRKALWQGQTVMLQACVSYSQVCWQCRCQAMRCSSTHDSWSVSQGSSPTLSSNGALHHARNHLGCLGSLQQAARYGCKITERTVARPDITPFKACGSCPQCRSQATQCRCQACGAAAAMTLGVLSRLAAHLSCDGALGFAPGTNCVVSGACSMQHGMTAGSWIALWQAQVEAL